MAGMGGDGKGTVHRLAVGALHGWADVLPPPVQYY
jgi:hypothetical protein